MSFDDDDETFRKRIAGELPRVQTWPPPHKPGPRHEMSKTIPTEMVKAKGLPFTVESIADAEVVRATEKAIRLRFLHRGIWRNLWFPRAAVVIGMSYPEGYRGTIQVQRRSFAQKVSEPVECDDMTLSEKQEYLEARKRLEEGPRSPLPPPPLVVRPPALPPPSPGRLDLSDEEWLAEQGVDVPPPVHPTPAGLRSSPVTFGKFRKKYRREEDDSPPPTPTVDGEYDLDTEWE